MERRGRFAHLPRKPATCHPERAHAAKGLCRRCYYQTPAQVAKRRAHAQTPESRARLASRRARPDVATKRRASESSKEYRAKERARYAARKDDPAFRARVRAAYRKTTTGWTAERYSAAMEAQAGRCNICQEAKRLYADHCHESGQPRALLCASCNFLEGVVAAFMRDGAGSRLYKTVLYHLAWRERLAK